MVLKLFDLRLGEKSEKSVFGKRFDWGHKVNEKWVYFVFDKGRSRKCS